MMEPSSELRAVVCMLFSFFRWFLQRNWSVPRWGVEPPASLDLKQRGLPVAYRGVPMGGRSSPARGPPLPPPGLGVLQERGRLVGLVTHHLGEQTGVLLD